ncbi:MAG TPA: nuclear transport factor 2 family protein, partial [Clostridiales bacterium]|nr:nuclear transport factor 2 family protein [Clostridiales bacterium]
MVKTELEAAYAYARAMNRLDCSEFIELLAPNAHYASMWVFEELENKDAISDYLTKKIEAVKKEEFRVYAELAKATISFPGKDCVAIAQKNKKVVIGVVTFEVSEGYIQRFDMCI